MIRWKNPRDNTKIVDLVRSQLVPLSPLQHPQDHRLHHQIVRRIRKGSTIVIARSHRSPPIGFLHMEFRDKALLIDLLAVDPRYQNKQLGTRLMQFAEQYGRKRGCTIAHVFVDEASERGLHFYQRLQYVVLRSIPSLLVVQLAKPLV